MTKTCVVYNPFATANTLVCEDSSPLNASNYMWYRGNMILPGNTEADLHRQNEEIIVKNTRL